MKVNVFKKHPLIICVALILLFSLLPIVWFSDGRLFFGHDATFPLDPQFSVSKSLSIWDYQFSIGQFNYRALQFLFPYYLFWAGLSSLGLPLVSIECLWAIFLFALTGLSMLYASLTFFKKASYSVAFVVSLFYMFNLYTLNMWRFGQTTTLILFAVAPLFLALFIRGLNSGKHLKYAVLISGCSVIFSAGFTGPPYVISLFILPCLLYLLYYVFTHGLKNLKSAGRFLLILFPLFIAVNLFWVIPLFISLFSLNNLLPTYGVASLSYYDFINPVPFYTVIQGTGFYAFQLNMGEYSAVPFATSYSEFPLSLISYTLIILAFAGFMVNARRLIKEPLNLYFGALALIGLLFSIGGNAPTGEFYKWMYLNFPGFWFFRSPYSNFAGLYIMGLALLVGLLILKLSSSSISLNWRRYLKYVAIFGIILLVLSNAYPLVNGDIKAGGKGFPDEQLAYPPLSVQIPQFYSTAGNWINDNPDDFNVLLLPHRNYLAYSWGYAGSDIVQNYVHKPLITGSAGSVGNAYSYKLINNVYDVLGAPMFSDTLSFLNVKYIWFSRELRTFGGLQNSSDIERIEDLLRNQEGIELRQVFGDVAIYENTFWVPNKVYSPSCYYVAENADEVLNFAGMQVANQMTVFIREQADFSEISSLLEKDSKNLNGSGAELEKAPLVTYYRAGSTNYVVAVENATQPFLLVFSESYDSNWLASIDGCDLSGSHFLANGYANSWYIDKTGSFTIKIEFGAQKLVYACFAFSIAVLAVCILYLSKYKLKSVTRYLKIRRSENIYYTTSGDYSQRVDS